MIEAVHLPAKTHSALHYISIGAVFFNDGCLNGKPMKLPATGRFSESEQHQQSRGCTSLGEFASALRHRSFA